MNRTELSSSFGKNMVNAVSRGVCVDWICNQVFVGIDHNLPLRIAVDSVSTVSSPMSQHSVAITCSDGSSFVVHAVIGRDSSVVVFDKNKLSILELGSTVTSVGFVAVKLLAVGLVAGDFQLWSLVASTAQCVYRYSLPTGSFPRSIVASADIIHIIPSRGRCVLNFDLVAAASGCALVDPLVLDAAPAGISACSTNGIVATVNNSSVSVVDTRTGYTQSVDCNGDTLFWWSGHLFVFTSGKSLLDVSWSNGLVGVATTTPTVGKAPVCIHPIDLMINDEHIEAWNFIDCKHGLLVTASTSNFFVFRIRQGDKRYPISDIKTKFELVQQECINNGTIQGVTIVSSNTCAVVVETETFRLESFTFSS